MEFKISDIKIKLSFFFPAIIALFLIYDKEGMLPFVLWGIFFHEIGHIIALFLTGKKIAEVYFSPVGINIKTKGLRNSLLKDIFIHMAGPFFNLMAFFIAISKDAYSFFAAANIVLFTFNMLPISNLDGGNILRLILIRWFSPEKADSIFSKISGVFILMILALGICIFIITKGNFTLILACFALYLANARGEIGY